MVLILIAALIASGPEGSFCTHDTVQLWSCLHQCLPMHLTASPEALVSCCLHPDPQGANSQAWAAVVQTLQLVSARALYGGEKVEMVFQDPAAAVAAGPGSSGVMPPRPVGECSGRSPYCKHCSQEQLQGLGYLSLQQRLWRSRHHAASYSFPLEAICSSNC